MAQIIYDATTFKGLILSGGSSLGTTLRCENFDAAPSGNATSFYHGFLTKFPKKEALGDTVTSKASRGIFVFVPADYAGSDTLKYVQAFNDGTLRYLNDSDVWTTLNSSFTTSNQFAFAQYSAKDRLFATNGREAVYKWAKNWTAGNVLRDKSGTATALTGTLTFTINSTAVTGSGTNFDGELVSGDWIRKSSTGEWYEVNTVTDDTNLVLVSSFLEASGAGVSGGSQEAATSTIRARFAAVWKDRLVLASGDEGNMPLVGSAVCGSTSTLLP